MIETLKEFIKIESVKSAGQPNMPYGKGIFDALMFVQSTAERLDLIASTFLGTWRMWTMGKARRCWPYSHIDVVPKGEGWTVPAFEGVEKDGRIYGRGAVDNKGPAIAALYALKALSDNCAQLNKKVRLDIRCGRGIRLGGYGLLQAARAVARHRVFPGWRISRDQLGERSAARAAEAQPSPIPTAYT